MILFQSSNISDKHILLIFGVGLIGRSIVTGLKRHSDEHSLEHLPYSWSDSADASADLKSIQNRLLECFSGDASVSRVSIVWSAGKAGFSAEATEVVTELDSFRHVLGMLEWLKIQLPGVRLGFHLLSSAGGLFEGQRYVTDVSEPAPKRLYGQLKLQQEMLLKELNSSIDVQIYRPTSVYGFGGVGKRMGLIPTLISNGLLNKTSTIFGNLSTLRDYVLSDDIGDYIARSSLSEIADSRRLVHLLATGKPSSIFEVRACVEYVVRRRLALKFTTALELENSVDITVRRPKVNLRWNPTDLHSGVSSIKSQMVFESLSTGEAS